MELCAAVLHWRSSLESKQVIILSINLIYYFTGSVFLFAVSYRKWHVGISVGVSKRSRRFIEMFSDNNTCQWRNMTEAFDCLIKHAWYVHNDWNKNVIERRAKEPPEWHSSLRHCIAVFRSRYSLGVMCAPSPASRSPGCSLWRTPVTTVTRISALTLTWTPSPPWLPALYMSLPLVSSPGVIVSVSVSCWCAVRVSC